MNYVLMTHNFDAETYLYKVEEYEKAKDLLQYLWEDYYNIEIAYGSHLIEGECYHEEDYAKVTWKDGCYTEFILIEGTDTIPEEFEKRWKEKGE